MQKRCLRRTGCLCQSNDGYLIVGCTAEKEVSKYWMVELVLSRSVSRCKDLFSNRFPDSVGSDRSQSREMDGRCPDLYNSSFTLSIVESLVEYAVLGMSVSVPVPV